MSSYYPAGCYQFLESEERESEITRIVEKKAQEKVECFLYHISELFEKFGVQSFDEYDGYDFDYALKKLRDVAEKEAKNEMNFSFEYDLED